MGTKHAKMVLILLSVGLLVALLGCSEPKEERLTGDKPPLPSVTVEQTAIEVVRASYCWSTACVDTIGPPEILGDRVPTTVAPHSKITITFDYRPQPTTLSLSRISSENYEASTEVKVRKGSFEAPGEPGVYYYSMLVHWLSKDRKFTRGDSYYAFGIEVR